MHMSLHTLQLLHLSGLPRTRNTLLVSHLTIPHPQCMAAEAHQQILTLTHRKLLHMLDRFHHLQCLILHTVVMAMQWPQHINQLTTDKQ